MTSDSVCIYRIVQVSRCHEPEAAMEHVFQVHGVHGHGQAVLRKKLSRGKILEFFATLVPCLIGVEACPGAHYWARELEQFGHHVKLMPTPSM